MARRMYSESQLGKIVDAKLEGYDASIPTDLTASGDVIKLEHDTTPLGEGIHLKQIFGKHSLTGNGNIDLYIHHIMLGETAQFGEDNSSYACLNILSSSNLDVDSIQDLNALLGTTKRNILCSGAFIADDGSLHKSFQQLFWNGSYATSKFRAIVDPADVDAIPTTTLTHVHDVIITL